MLKNIEIGTSNNTCEEDHDDDKLKFSCLLILIMWVLNIAQVIRVRGKMYRENVPDGIFKRITNLFSGF